MSRAQCYVFGIVIGLVLAPFAVMLLDRREPITLTFAAEDCEAERCHGQIVPYYARSEEKVSINWPVIENRVCEGRYQRRIKEMVTGRIVIFDDLPVNYQESIDPKKPKWFSKPLVLPKLSPGPAIYWTEGNRWCNFMQKYFWPIPFRSPDIYFQVLPDKTWSPGLQGPQGQPGIQGYQGVQGIQGERGQRGPPAD
jgi:hypothetical protein